MDASIEREWRQCFVAYEDALASFYALQDATRLSLETSRSTTSELRRLASLRGSVLEAGRQLRTSAGESRVMEIERARATIDLDGVPVEVADLVASRAASDDTLLELCFRVDPKTLPRFMKLTEPIRIRFPFGETTFVAAYRLVRFRMVRQEFAFRFATVDPA